MIGTITQYPLSYIPPEFSNAEPSAFSELLKNPEAELVYLIELMPYNSSKANVVSGLAPLGVNPLSTIDFGYLGGTETIYISDKGYMTEPNETPSSKSYLPLTPNPYQFDVSILQGDEFRGSSPSFGAVRLLNGDTNLESLTSYYWGGRNIKVMVGSPAFPKADFITIFDGLATKPEFNEDEIIINISDKSQILETEFQQNLYDENTVNSDLLGLPKPLVYGECKNIAPVLIDASNLIYQAHDGSIESVSKVYDRGVELTNEGNVTDITATSVSAGHYKTQLSGGLIKLGSTPDGRITADVQGDNTGGYVSNAGVIVSRLVQTKLGSKNFSSSQVDQGSLNRVDAAITGDIGVYITDKTTARSVIDTVLNNLQCYWTFTRNGKLTAGVLDSPSAGVLTISEKDIYDNEIKCLRVIEPSWRISLGYGRSWTTQTKDDLAAGASNAYQTFAAEPYRKTISEDRNIRTLTSSLVERSFNCSLVDEADSLIEIERFKNIYRTMRKVYEVSVKSLLFRLSIGDSVNLKLERFGLDEGQDFIITSISEDAESGKTKLELWG